MLEQVRNEELELFVSASGDERPADEDEVSLTALVPAFVLSELKTAFIIGFIVFIPFLVIDIVVSSSLMSDRKSVVQGRSVSVRGDLGGSRIIIKKKNKIKQQK